MLPDNPLFLPNDGEKNSLESLRKQYFGKLTDLCWIFWTEHAQNVQNPDYPFAVSSYRGYPVDFSLTTEAYYHLVQTDRHTQGYFSPQDLFTKGAAERFNAIVRPQLSRAFYKKDEPNNDFLITTANQAESLRQMLPETHRLSSLQREIVGGYKSALQTYTQCQLLSNLFSHIDGLNSKVPVYLSSLSLADLSEAQHGLGLRRVPHKPKHIGLYELIDQHNQQYGIDIEKLHQLHLSESGGCPARKLPSENCSQYIEERYGFNPTGRILFDVQSTAIPEFEKKITAEFPLILEKNPELGYLMYPDEVDLLLGQVPDILRR